MLYSIGQSLEAFVGWIFSPAWLPPKDFQFFRWLVVPGYGYGFVLVGLAILEVIRPQVRRPWNRATILSGTYLLFAGKMALYAFLVTPLLRKGWLYFGLPSLHLDRVLPAPVYVVVALLVITFVGYWAHRGMHRLWPCWEIHKIHHSVQNMNCTSIYHKHFLELLLHTPLAVMSSLLLGTELVAPLGIIWVATDLLGHSNIRLDIGRLSYVISTPQAHRVHHSTNRAHYDRNFGNQFMLWDHVFGTFYYDPKDAPLVYGVDEQVPLSFLKQQILPFVWIASEMKTRWRASWRSRQQADFVNSPE